VEALRTGVKATRNPVRNELIVPMLEYDKDLYRLRHLLEHAVLYLKRWRAMGYTFRQQCGIIFGGNTNTLHCFMGYYCMIALSREVPRVAQKMGRSLMLNSLQVCLA
jgi:hypothetical protein